MTPTLHFLVLHGSILNHLAHLKQLSFSWLSTAGTHFFAWLSSNLLSSPFCSSEPYGQSPLASRLFLVPRVSFVSAWLCRVHYIDFNDTISREFECNMIDYFMLCLKTANKDYLSTHIEIMAIKKPWLVPKLMLHLHL